ncbi:hypothetical protein VE04_10062 [Pseudogymnoascus sp. 24MN13]|nr:hypothetical protein VE04_10062 [Pseudogymnoascus sp. 24MN13]
MSNWKVPEGLIDWQNVSEHDGVLTVEKVATTEFLTGESFLSNCHLPDVKPNTKIVGICGITDWNKENDPKLPGDAAPNQEGWHFTDFYLFHHLLKEVASDQVWLTCVSPESAVEKYGRYVYGDYNPKKIEERRVVLDESKLGELNDVQTVSPEDLLENVLEAISKTCIDAAAEKRPVLILIFSRSSQPAYSIVMGGENAEDPKYLTKESFRQAIGSQAPEAGLCLLATEYRTGAWAINPDMNVAPVASQGKYLESMAWPISGTNNKRPCGPEFSHRIVDMLLRLHLEGYETVENDGDKDPDFEEHEERLSSVIEGILQKEESKDMSLFSGDDEWETEYSERIGIHISEFHRRWCLLKDATSGYDELLTAVKNEAKVYFNSFPGLDYKIRNRALHKKLRGITKGTLTPNFIELELLQRQIDYRLKLMKMATKYKDLWHLSMKNCEDVEVEIGAGIGTHRWYQLCKLVESYHLFDHRDYQGEGEEYEKGNWYIASCIHSQGWDDTQAGEKIGILIPFKVTEAPVRNETESESAETIASSWCYDQDLFVLQKEAKQYFDSGLFPHDTASDLGLNNFLRNVIKGTREHGPEHLRCGVDHRVNQIMGTATLYKDFLDIDYPDCHEVEVHRFWCDDYKRYREIKALISTYPLFNVRYHRPFYKGGEYLAQSISTQEWSESESETIAKLDSLVKYRGPITCPLFAWPGGIDTKYVTSGVPNVKNASRILETVNHFQLSRDERIRVLVWKLGQITDRKIRSLPTNSCRRKRLPGNLAKEGVTTGIGKLSLEGGSSC